MAHEGHDHHHHHAPVHEHREQSPVSVAAFVITCSDTRNAPRDESGRVAEKLLTDAGHSLVGRAVVRDDVDAIRSEVQHALDHGARAIVITGGTGISRRDVTVEAVAPLFEKQLDGFGELFRALSSQQVGSAAWLSRAMAGTYRGAVVFALPGSPQAVTLALTKLILPELGHAVRELMR